MNNIEIVLLIAIILFAVAGVIRLMARGFDAALVAFGLALFALAFIINP